MFAYVEGGKLIKFAKIPEHPETGEPLNGSAKGTLANLGWLPVVVQAIDVGDDETRAEDIIYIDGDVVRVVQTVRTLSDEEAFHKIKNNIMAMIEGVEDGQSDRAERELLLELSEHLNLTSSKAYEILKGIDDNIAAKRALLGQ
ncbi:hypothetical protein RYZ26_18140 [Terasakiella sp. A23]|uniref:hypothetical protein n=1 Tax=Terasakiella sp. FCG-A23 TaxID=3080561 RepID=UPI0029552A07|nr:hypothetical protein [Terasakiella sp. A23]MDV7341531.1 hypothetical protein [Terasakiella sp. A23]